jgi:hypothetical protein
VTNAEQEPPGHGRSHVLFGEFYGGAWLRALDAVVDFIAEGTHSGKWPRPTSHKTSFFVLDSASLATQNGRRNISRVFYFGQSTEILKFSFFRSGRFQRSDAAMITSREYRQFAHECKKCAVETDTDEIRKSFLALAKNGLSRARQRGLLAATVTTRFLVPTEFSLLHARRERPQRVSAIADGFGPLYRRLR